MPQGYYPLALWNYTPVLKPMPVPGIQSATEAPLVCVQMSAALVPYIVGLLEIYRWSDKFLGTSEEVKTALGVIQDLIVILTEGNCPDCPESPMPTVFRFTGECGLEYSNDNGSVWIAVPGWTQFAQICFKGDKGDTGAQGPAGPQGIQGPKGDPGECPECTQPVPANPNTPSDGLRCSISINLARELRRIWDFGYTNSGNYISDYIGLNISAMGLVAFAIPGVNAFAAGAAVIAGVLTEAFKAYENGESNAFNDAAEQRYRCMLYCLLDQNGTINRTVLDAWYAAIQADTLNPFANEAAMLVNSVPTDHWQWLAYASSEVNPLACESCVCAEDRLISFEVATSNAPEGNAHLVKVKLTSPDALPSPVTVTISAANGTATTPADYTLLDTSVTFPAGSPDGTLRDIAIAIPFDGSTEPNETFTLTIDSVAGAATIDQTAKTHTVTISDVPATKWTWRYDQMQCNYNLPSGWQLSIISGHCGNGNGSFDGFYADTSLSPVTLEVVISPTRPVKTLRVWMAANTSTGPNGNYEITVGSWTQNATLAKNWNEYWFPTVNSVGSITFKLTQSGTTLNGVGISRIEVEYQ